MQQHDRLMQQMTHVSEALAALLAILQKQPQEEDWVCLRREQLSRFSMTEERALFQLLLPHADVVVEPDAANSVELF